MWGAGYAIVLALLVLRVRGAEASPPAVIRPLPGEPLWITRLHHGLFALILLGSPLEQVLAHPASGGRGAGLLIFVAGVALYRIAGRALGDALSPFIEPRDDAPLVTHGLYRHVRHPIYLAEAMIAIGAPLTLGCRWTLVPSAAALAVLTLRIAREEEALGRTFPDYHRYAAKTKRLVPFVY